MPKINVYLPDELAEAVRESGVPVSAICQRALEQAVRRVTAIRETTLGHLDLDDLAARLPHFTARAQAVLRLARERAQAEGVPTVGTEHLLGGILAEGGNVALHVLRAVELEPEQLERDLDQLAVAATPEIAGEQSVAVSGDRPAATSSAASGKPPASRFSGPAANALELTVTEATALGHNYVGCEHLLLGLLTEPDGTAGQMLRARGVEPRLTRRAVAAWLAGYVHLRTQTQQPGTGAAGADPAKAIGAVVRQELQPLIQRIERIEGLVGVVPEQ
ncbi:hypothetical protein GCM10027280_09780 [Micromonospora polyrhachis]|uniref:ATP-dependent Clp protease ATP-binding subunit ClpC n=1 Tax=Micromonospora polyrhachis TaxID=1282883 RepID=A0A7W7SNP8_9ACTN|nr:Clp protease N-terminal domain-containing protein [Micromonospora polyrhachis]MBB4958163.1 ATP-dependent Clp protease ATP-binding subunit ClpC [Micromonospora polyrhachis]